MAPTTDYLDIGMRLLNYLASRPGKNTVPEIAQALKLETRVVLNTLGWLNFCGPIDGGYQAYIDIPVERNFYTVMVDDQGCIPPLRLTSVEAASLLINLERLKVAAEGVDLQALDSAMDKIRRVMGESFTGVVVDASAIEPDPVLATLKNALIDSLIVDTQYANADERAVEPVRLVPIQLFTWEGNRYLRALDCTDGVTDGSIPKNYRLDRFDVVTASQDRHSIDTDDYSVDPADPFDFENANCASIRITGDNAWRSNYYPITIDTTVHTEVDEPFVGEIRHFRPSWLIGFALSCGGGVEVVTPREVREEIYNKAVAGLAAYDQQPAER